MKLNFSFFHSVSVNGGYSRWEEWGPCSSSCGQGLQERIRLCNNPEPTNGGRSCSGPSVETRKCQTGLCPGRTAWFFFYTAVILSNRTHLYYVVKKIIFNESNLSLLLLSWLKLKNTKHLQVQVCFSLSFLFMLVSGWRWSSTQNQRQFDRNGEWQGVWCVLPGGQHYQQCWGGQQHSAGTSGQHPSHCRWVTVKMYFGDIFKSRLGKLYVDYMKFLNLYIFCIKLHFKYSIL